MKRKILHLTVSKEPFEVMVTGEKNIEFRKPSEWIKRRLFNKDGSRKDYDVVKFTNGYGKDKPFFTATFNGFATYIEECFDSHLYSNGLRVKVEQGDIQVYLGDVLTKGNLR